jgi:hypothetical protein
MNIHYAVAPRHFTQLIQCGLAEILYYTELYRNIYCGFFTKLFADFPLQCHEYCRHQCYLFTNIFYKKFPAKNNFKDHDPDPGSGHNESCHAPITVHCAWL